MTVIASREKAAIMDQDLLTDLKIRYSSTTMAVSIRKMNDSPTIPKRNRVPLARMLFAVAVISPATMMREGTYIRLKGPITESNRLEKAP